MDPLTLQAGEQLRDIQGIQGVPWWPPAPGWWLLAGTLLALIIAARLWPRRRPWPPRLPRLVLSGWRSAATRELRRLRRRAPEQSPKETAGELSELLRRIAMARFARASCAGLAGPEWLRWLSENDPSGFDWERRGLVLLKAPYAPDAAAELKAELLVLIDAAEAWAAGPLRGPARPPQGRPTAAGGGTGV